MSLWARGHDSSQDPIPLWFWILSPLFVVAVLIGTVVALSIAAVLWFVDNSPKIHRERPMIKQATDPATKQKAREMCNAMNIAREHALETSEELKELRGVVDAAEKYFAARERHFNGMLSVRESLALADKINELEDSMRRQVAVAKAVRGT